MARRYFHKTLGEIRQNWIIDLLASNPADGSFRLATWNGQELFVGHEFTYSSLNGSRKNVYLPLTSIRVFRGPSFFPPKSAGMEAPANCMRDFVM